MAGPWEKYSAPQAAAPAANDGPWAKYGAPAPAEAAPTAPVPGQRMDFGPPPAGVIIHEKNSDYVSDRPDLVIPRASDNGADRGQAVRQMGLLKSRNLSQEAAPTFQGVSLGWGDEAVSGIAAALRAAQGGNFQDTYDINQEAQKQALGREEAAHPYRSMAGKIGGGALTVIGAAPATLTGLAAEGTGGLATRFGASVLDGLGIGAIQGAGEADAGNRMEGAGRGAALGAAAGAVAYPVSAGINAAVRSALDYGATAGGAQALGSSRGAVERLTRAMRDDAVTPQAVSQRAAELGPDGMVLDLSPNATGLAQGVSRIPGGGQTTIRNAIDQRAAGAGGRITQSVDTNVGPAASRVQTAADIDTAYRNAADPLYTQFRASPVPYTTEVEGVLNRVKLQPEILRAARRMNDLDKNSGAKQFFANIAPDGTVTTTRVPNANELDLVKRALDDAGKAGGNEGRIYKQVAGDLREAVDNAMSPGNPSGSIYAQARKAAGEGLSVQDALEQGQGVFANAVAPEEVATNLAKMSPGAKAAFLKGARESIGQVMGTARSDAGAARALLAKGWNQEKLAAVVGPQRAAAVMKTIDAENAFQGTKNAVTGNSVTAQATKAQEGLTPPKRDIGLFGQLDRLGGKAVNAALGARDRAVYRKIGDDLGNLLVTPLGSPNARVIGNLASRRAGTQQITGPRTLGELLMIQGATSNRDARNAVPGVKQFLRDLSGY